LEPRNGADRPIRPARLLRSRLIRVRFLEEELEAVERYAAGARLSLAAYLRAAALRPNSPPPVVPALNVAVYAALGRIVGRLHELATFSGAADLGAEARGLRRHLIGLDPAWPENRSGTSGGAP
jgi:mobilization protein NikA